MRSRTCGLLLRGGKVLLQRKHGETIWALPGGRVEPGETPEAALVREWHEELGCVPTILRLIWMFTNNFQHRGEEISQTEFYFELSVAGDVKPSDSTLEFLWFSATELIAVDFRPHRLRGELFAPPRITTYLP